MQDALLRGCYINKANDEDSSAEETSALLKALLADMPLVGVNRLPFCVIYHDRLQLPGFLKGERLEIKRMRSQSGVESACLGMHRLKLVELVCVILQMSDKQLEAILLAEGVLASVLDLFFEFQWCNMLHSVVAGMVVATIDHGSEDLQRSLIADAMLLSRIMASYNCQDAPCHHGSSRPGHIGYLNQVSNEIVAAVDMGQTDSPGPAAYFSEVAKQSGCWEQWEAFVLSTLADINVQTTIPLGDSAPQHDMDDDDLFNEQLSEIPAFEIETGRTFEAETETTTEDDAFADFSPRTFGDDAFDDNNVRAGSFRVVRTTRVRCDSDCPPPGASQDGSFEGSGDSSDEEEQAPELQPSYLAPAADDSWASFGGDSEDQFGSSEQTEG